MVEQVCVRMNSACMRRLDHAYIDPYPKTLINTKAEQKLKTYNLTTYHA